MKKIFEILTLLGIFVSFLITLKYVYGAGSLSELQNQTSYRSELINYLHTHNMTVMDTQLKSDILKNVNRLDTGELEKVLDQHMQDCQSGSLDGVAKIFNLSKAEMSKIYGDC